VAGRAVATLAVRAGVGLVLAAAGWVGARGEVALDRQAPWIALSVAGLLVGSASAALWLLQLRRAVARRTAEVHGAVLRVEVARPGATQVLARRDLVRVRRTRGGHLYHRPGCALVAGRAVKEGDPARWQRAGVRPCEACGA
jgi:hypothetical protein